MILAGHGRDDRLIQAELPMVPNVGDRIRENCNPKTGDYQMAALIREGIFIKVSDNKMWRCELANGKLSNFDPSASEVIDRAPVLVEKEISLESLLEQPQKPYVLKVIELPFEYDIPTKERANENYTPDYVLDACRKFLNGFDLDPFSNPIAQRSVRATKFWTKEDNSLIQDWTPYIKKWCNPPYNKLASDGCIDKILKYKAIGETILLVNSSTSAKWFQRCMNACTAYVHPSKRIPFYNPYRELEILNGDRDKSSNEYDQTLFYFGDRPLDFAQALAAIGQAVQPIRSIDADKLPVIVDAIATKPSKSVANLRMDEGSISVLVGSDDRLSFLLEQREKLIASGASPQGVWINCGKVYKKDFKQAVWKSEKPRPEWGDKKSCYIGKFRGDEHISAIAKHRARQELNDIEREIKKLSIVKS